MGYKQLVIMLPESIGKIIHINLNSSRVSGIMQAVTGIMWLIFAIVVAQRTLRNIEFQWMIFK